MRGGGKEKKEDGRQEEGEPPGERGGGNHRSLRGTHLGHGAEFGALGRNVGLQLFR